MDEFQKQLIWQWLFVAEDEEGNSESAKIYVTYNNSPVTANSDYKIFVASYDDLTNIRVLPEQETQELYLTGITNNKSSYHPLVTNHMSYYKRLPNTEARYMGPNFN